MIINIILTLIAISFSSLYIHKREQYNTLLKESKEEVLGLIAAFEEIKLCKCKR